MAKDPYDRLHAVFGRWWRGLNDSNDEGERGENADRADAARLRRIATYPSATGPRVDVATALTIGAFRSLHSRLWTPEDDSEAWAERLVVAAVSLAHVRKDEPRRMTAQLLGGAEGDRKVMAESRFLRLLRVRTPAELMDEGRRVAALLKTGAPVADLGASLMVWLDDPNRRRLWAQSYYGLGAPPAALKSSSDQSIEPGVLQS